jgi:hypothetical protein
VRTTVTLDPDVEALLQRAMKQKGLSFKEALNSAIRQGLVQAKRPAAGSVPALPVFDMKARAEVNLDKALRLASELEDEEQSRKLALGK